MGRSILSMFFVLSCAVVSFGQATTTTDDSRLEFFAGYSNLQAEGIAGREVNQGSSFDDEVFGDRQGLNGFNVAGTGYFTRNLGLTGDFSYNVKQDEFNVNSQAVNQRNERTTHVFNFLAGPSYKFRNESRVTPFVRALAGVAHTRFSADASVSTATGTTSNSFETNTTDFALGVGGGVDVRLTDRIDLRVLQVDWNPVFLGDRSVQRLNVAGNLATQTLDSQRADNVRFSFGVVFK